MASNTFYATSQSGGLSALLNNGETSWERSAHTGSTEWKNVGLFSFNTSSIPSVCTINSVSYAISIKQNRTSTSLYQTSAKGQLFVGSTAVSSNNISDQVATTYSEKSYSNTSTISPSSVASSQLKVQWYVGYLGALKTTQYAKGVKITVNWTPIKTSSISISYSSVSLNVNGAKQLTYVRTPSSVTYSGVTWSSSNTSVATVDSNGKVTAKGNGTCTITLKTESNDGSKTSTCSITVTTPVSSVSLNKSSTSIQEGDTETLTATVSPSTASNKNITWSSSNTSIATVSNGTVTAVGAGTCTITATSQSDTSKKATCSVTVTEPEGIKVRLGSGRLKALYLGSTQITHCYLGSTQIF